MSARARVLALVLVALGACKTYGSMDRSQGYTGKPASAAVEDVPVRGNDVEIEHGDDSTSGELLAIDDTYIYVLASGHTQAIDRRKVRRVTLQLYPSQATATGLWAALGAGSTISHGVFLVFSAPVWIGTGIGATAAAANSSELEVDKLAPLYQFARFPQGLPPTWPGARRPRDAGAD